MAKACLSFLLATLSALLSRPFVCKVVLFGFSPCSFASKRMPQAPSTHGSHVFLFEDARILGDP